MSSENPFKELAPAERPGNEVPAAEKREPARKSIEQKKAPDLHFYITDHSADSAETGSPDALRKLYADIKRDGIDSVRYDWRWKNIESEPGKFNVESLKRYQQAKEIMAETGLKEPTIILSDIPEWAKELYKKDKEKFFEEYAKYVAEVKRSLNASGGGKISTVQILNELNNSVYTPVKAEDLPRLCQITRDALRDYNPDAKLMGTLLASNTTRFVGTPIEQYLPEFKKVKDSFDSIAVDYYPGMWHLSPKDTASLRPSDIYKAMVKIRNF